MMNRPGFRPRPSCRSICNAPEQAFERDEHRPDDEAYDVDDLPYACHEDVSE